MSKKKFGKFVALAAVSGVIAAGVSYFLKYKSFNSELDDDFHDFEGEDDEFDGELPHASETPARTYVTLNEKKDDAEKIPDAASEKADNLADAASEKAADMSEMVKSAVTETAEAVKKAAENSASTTIEDDDI